MQNKKRLSIFGGIFVLVVVAVAGGASIVAATGGDSDQPITGDALNQATNAALGFTGGGYVSDTEVGDEESYYQVEVTLDDGSHVDVQLDEDFKVVGSKAESGIETNDDNGQDDGENGDGFD